MASFNQCVFVGNLGKEPELKQVAEDRSVCRFSIAVDGYKKDDAPMWVPVAAWGELGKRVQKYLHTGSLVLVSGRLSVRRYTDNTNVERTAVEIVADDIRFLDQKPRTAVAEAQETASAAA